MSDPEVRFVEIPETGDAGSFQMVKSLQQIMHGVAQSLPFEFHTADLVAAHLKCAFDLTIMSTTLTPQQTREWIIRGLDALVGDAEESKRRAN